MSHHITVILPEDIKDNSKTDLIKELENSDDIEKVYDNPRSGFGARDLIIISLTGKYLGNAIDATAKGLFRIIKRIFKTIRGKSNKYDQTKIELMNEQNDKLELQDEKDDDKLLKKIEEFLYI